MRVGLGSGWISERERERHSSITTTDVCCCSSGADYTSTASVPAAIAVKMNVRNFLHARLSPFSVYISLSPRRVLIPLLHLISSEESQQAVWWLDPSNMAAWPLWVYTEKWGVGRRNRWTQMQTTSQKDEWEMIWGPTEGNCIINTTTKDQPDKRENPLFLASCGFWVLFGSLRRPVPPSYLTPLSTTGCPLMASSI